jgi:translin
MSESPEYVSMQQLIADIRTAGEAVNSGLSSTHAAREKALSISRQVVRTSANSIRATHRGEFDEARRLIASASDLREELEVGRSAHPEVYYGGYVEDALKEYVEAHATLAFAQGSSLPTMEELNVGAAVYINGLAEAVGEMRRLVLDLLRSDSFDRCETFLEIMDEVYAVLVTLDYPDGVTRGLRRTTDVMRGVIERTRGDLTVALRQRSLERRMAELSRRIDAQ